MFRGTFQTGYLSIFYSVGSNPLQIWSKQQDDSKNRANPDPTVADVLTPDHIEFVDDNSISSQVLEITGDLPKTSITCPAHPSLSLGITLPYLVLLAKNVRLSPPFFHSPHNSFLRN